MVFVFISCEKGTEPENTKPGSREYEWKSVSISDYNYNNLYTQIGGVSHDEIWLTSYAGDYNQTILKYDGDSITNFASLSIDPKAVFGLVQNEIWFTGAQFDIWKYNGSTISKFSTHILDDYYASFIVDIWGSSKNNLFAVGSGSDNFGRVNSLIMHYNGSFWEYSIPPIPDLHFIKIRKGADNNYYLLGIIVKAAESDVYGFYKYNGKGIVPFHFSGESITKKKSMTSLNNEVYFYDDKEIYKMTNNGVQHFLSFQNTNVDGGQIWGRNEKDFFIQTMDGIGHYNGTNLETLFKIEGDFGILDGLIIDSDVYFVGFYRDTFKCFLIHGQIKE